MERASPMPVKFTRNNAVAQVQRLYDGVDGFVAAIADEFPGYLDGENISPEVIAGALGIPVPAFLQVINSNAYQTALDAYAASVTYNLQARIRAMNVLKETATGGQKLVMSPKGDAVYVDRDTGEIIAADKYLRSLQGRPVETGKGIQASGITIQFGDSIEETHQHVHFASDSPAGAEGSGRTPQRLDWGEAGSSGGAPDEEGQRTIEADPATTRGSGEQPDSRTRQGSGRSRTGTPAHSLGQNDPDDDSGADYEAYTAPQPGSGPPAGQARAYARNSSSKPFQSYDAEIVTGQAPHERLQADSSQTKDMDRLERHRRIGYGLHQTPPRPSEARQARGTDETPSQFKDFLGGDTPITHLTKTEEGEEAVETLERRSRAFQAGKEDKLRRYLSQKPLVEQDPDD